MMIAIWDLLMNLVGLVRRFDIDMDPLAPSSLFIYLQLFFYYLCLCLLFEAFKDLIGLLLLLLFFRFFY